MSVGIVPEALRDHILPFDWEVTLVWAEECSVESVPRARFDYLLELPLWSSRRGGGMMFDLSPMAVLADPRCCPWQWERIQGADLQFPLDFLVYLERPWILDGVHRLAKAYQLGWDEVSVRLHPETVLPRIC